MAVTKTSRLGLTRWSAGADPLLRSQIDDAHRVLDDAAIDMQGTYAARPAPAVRGRFYYATDYGDLYRDTGTEWKRVGQQALPGSVDIPASGGWSGTAKGVWRNGSAVVVGTLTASTASPGEVAVLPAGMPRPFGGAGAIGVAHANTSVAAPPIMNSGVSSIGQLGLTRKGGGALTAGMSVTFQVGYIYL